MKAGGRRMDRALALRAAIARADPPDREWVEARLDRAARACGCATGSVALLAAVVGAVAWWLVALDAGLDLWPEAMVAAFGVVGAAFVGKLAGLATAELWLWWAERRFLRP